MTLLLAALGVLLGGGALALAAGSRPALALRIGSASAVAGSALGLVPALRTLAGGATRGVALPWSAPNASFHVALDPLSAFFAVALFALTIPAAVFGASYLRSRLARRSLPAFLFFFNLLVASIALVFVARQAVLFLVAWEVMAVSSFLLVTFDHEEEEVRNAGLVFLVASHLGTAFLIALFALLGRSAGGLDFDAFAARAAATAPAGLLFGLAVVGFGTKAGLVPLHVWLPEAHPAAPSHVSALLSGVMIKTGLYGILRTLEFLPHAPPWWGLALGAAGLAGALVAITLALGERDLKRALAYSSVENMGIVFLGTGLGMWAAATGAVAVAALAWAGALLHVWNHALMKGLAFMGAGALAHASHTRDLERMGGLLARLPRTGALFLVGAAALAALPPLNGFASEWLVYVAMLEAAEGAAGSGALAGWMAVAGLAFVGGVAGIAFTRIAGVALLGAPRSGGAEAAREPDAAIWAPLAALAAACLALGIAPAAALRLARPAIEQVAGFAGARLAPALGPAQAALLEPVRAIALALLALAAGLALAATRLRRARPPAAAETWSCGYSRPTARMAYTASSYAQLFLSGLAPRLLQPRGRVVPPRGILPPRSSASWRSEDPARSRLFDPLFRELGRRASQLRRFQADKLNLQLLYTLAALVALVVFLFLHP